MAAIMVQDTPLTQTIVGGAKRFTFGQTVPALELGGKQLTAECYGPTGAIVYVSMDVNVSPTRYMWSFRPGDVFMRTATQGPNDRIFPRDYYFAVSVDGAGWTFGLE